MPEDTPPQGPSLENDYFKMLNSPIPNPASPGSWVTGFSPAAEPPAPTGSPPAPPPESEGAESWGRWLVEFLTWFTIAWNSFKGTWEVMPHGDVIVDHPPNWVANVHDRLTQAARAVQRFRTVWVFKPPHLADSLPASLRETRDYIQSGQFASVDIDRVGDYKRSLEDAIDKSMAGVRTAQGQGPPSPQVGTQAGGQVDAERPTGKRRAGRLSKEDGEAKQAYMLALIRQHPTLKDDPGELARLVGVSESTIRRWLEDEEQKYRESKAANPEPAEE